MTNPERSPADALRDYLSREGKDALDNLKKGPQGPLIEQAIASVPDNKGLASIGRFVAKQKVAPGTAIKTALNIPVAESIKNDH